MARYFFDLFNDEETRDTEGTDLPDDGAARECARREVLIQAAESIRRHAHFVRHHRIVIRNDSGQEIAAVRFGDVVSVRD